jgi:hypothetical protein
MGRRRAGAIPVAFIERRDQDAENAGQRLAQLGVDAFHSGGSSAMGCRDMNEANVSVVISYRRLPRTPLFHSGVVAHAGAASTNRGEQAMGIFSTIMDKIFHHANAAQPASTPQSTGTGTTQQSQAGTSAQPSGARRAPGSRNCATWT